MANSTTDNFEFKAIPTFRIKNYQTAINFYVGFLGFKIDWEHRFGPTEPIYMQISKNGLLLHLSENERFQTGFIVFVETKGLVSFHKQLQKNNPTKQLPEILKTGWQTLQLEITDPFGNLLRLNENI